MSFGPFFVVAPFLCRRVVVVVISLFSLSLPSLAAVVVVVKWRSVVVEEEEVRMVSEGEIVSSSFQTPSHMTQC